MRYLFNILAAAALSLPLCTLAAPLPNADLVERMDRLVQMYIPRVAYGMRIQDAQTGRVLFEEHSFESFPPASNTKIFTAAGALLLLGKDFTYKTTLAIDKKKRSHGVLAGNLYLKFTGDPTLRRSDLDKLFAQLAKFKVHHIKGDVLIDTSIFSGPNYAPGNTHDSIHWDYSAPVSAVILDDNSVNLTLTPSKTLGALATVQANGSMFGIQVAAKVKTVTEDEANHWCSLMLKMDASNAIQMAGCWPIGENAIPLDIAVQNPEKRLQDVIKAQLKAQKIQLDGTIRFAAMAKSYTVVKQHRSRPLYELLKPMLRDSNNLVADSLVKTLGAKHYKVGSFQAGVRALEATLQKPMGIDKEALVLFDGSGLSRYNLASPLAISQVLYGMYHSPMRALFVDALAQSGTSGTLSRRLATTDLLKKMHAKTGTLHGVSALSGYLTTQRNQTLIIVLMLDHITQPMPSVYAFQSDMLELLSRYHFAR